MWFVSCLLPREANALLCQAYAMEQDDEISPERAVACMESAYRKYRGVGSIQGMADAKQFIGGLKVDLDRQRVALAVAW